MGTLSNVKVEPMNVTWGESTVQVETVTTIADVAASLNNDYFFMYHTDGTKHYWWFDVASGGSDPAIAGATAHEVDISSGATAAAVATALEAAIEAVSGFDSTVSDNVITVTHSAAGYCTPAHDGNSGFTFAVTTEGDDATDMGFTEGDIEVALEEQLTDIVAHQSGTNVLSQIRTGKSVEVTLNFMETSIAQLKKMIRQGGGSLTPTGVSGTDVHGWGQSADFTQTILRAKKLYLHPTSLSASDKTRDMTFWKAYPLLESINFSGENKFVIPVTFKIYPDTSKNSRVQYYAYGDGSQTLT